MVAGPVGRMTTIGWVLTPAERAVVARMRRRKHVAYELRRHVAVRRQTAVRVKGLGLDAGRNKLVPCGHVASGKPKRFVVDETPNWWRPADCVWDGDQQRTREAKRVA